MSVGAAVATVLLLAANAFFVAIEFALVALRRTRLEQLVDEGNRRAAVALAAARRLSRAPAGAQLGITMASLGLGYVAEPAIGSLVESALGIVGLPNGVEHSIAVAVALVIVVFLHMVIGEMAPKNAAIAEPERTAMLLTRPMNAFMTVFEPAIAVLNAAANAFLRVIGIEPREELLAAHTPEEIVVMLAQSHEEGLVEASDRDLLTGALAFRARSVREVMVPRSRIVAVPRMATPTAVARIADESGHSRFPVFERDLDRVVGFVHVKSLLDVADAGWDLPLPARIVRPMVLLVAGQRLPDALLAMQRLGVHFGLVVDDDGAASGIVTLEDVLEALVGDIRDEFDRAG